MVRARRVVMVSAEQLSSSEITLLRPFPESTFEDLRWCSITLKEVQDRGARLDASVFNTEGKHAKEVLKRCKWQTSVIAGDNGLSKAYHRPRFKRIWIDESGIPIFQPSQITEINPKPSGYLSTRTDTIVDALRIRKGQILLTCSGTIGKLSYVGDTMDGQVFSHDLIRITCNEEEDAGYLYAFLRTKIGNALICTNEYGSVVSHIEPEHLESVPIPDPPVILKKQIHDLVIRSYALCDESNALLDNAERLLYDALKLPPLLKLRPHYFDKTADLRNYAVNLSDAEGRLDASYHVPIVDSIIRCLKKEAAEITNIGDPCISKRIILPGRFARVYVEEGQGVPFFGGKQIYELDPTNKKYLSFVHHGKRIKDQLTLEENMVLITCSGTIGKVALVAKHWEGWTANQHIIRVVPATADIAGYLYVFLSTEYGCELITHFTYGSVVDEINDHHVCQVLFPLLKDSSIQTEINCLALKANAKRTEAYYAEQEAIRITNDEVIYASEK
jgi:type I restriction enzyme S subunit